MKLLVYSFFVFCLFSCKNSVEKVGDCKCQDNIMAEKEFQVINVSTNSEKNDKVSFNCAKVNIPIFSTTDLEGNETCESSYEIDCISDKKDVLKLEKNFIYWKEEYLSADITTEGAQVEFFDDIKNFEKSLFTFKVNRNNEIISISKL